MRAILAIIVGLAALVVLTGFGGRWLPLSDLVALLRVPAAVVLLSSERLFPGGGKRRRSHWL